MNNHLLVSLAVSLAPRDWNSRKPAYFHFHKIFLRPVTGNKLRALKSHMLICPEIGIVFFMFDKIARGQKHFNVLFMLPHPANPLVGT